MADRGTDREMEDADLPELSDAANILLLAPSISAAGAGACLTLLTRDPPAEEHVLTVTFTETPDQWLAEWADQVGEPPAKGMVIGVGGTNQTYESATEVPGVSADRWQVATVDNPSDLTGLGIELSEAIEGLDGDSDAPTAICFNSLTALLQYADLQRAFRFLHVVTGRVSTAGAVAHYHLDPDAYDRQTVATITGLFDAVVEVDDDGEWTVKTR